MKCGYLIVYTDSDIYYKSCHMKRNINEIIKESVKNALYEMDLVHRQGNAKLVQNQAINAWRMIYSLMDNVKTSMDATIEGKKKYDHYGKYASSNLITNQDVDNIIDYIYNALQNITRNTIGRE